MVIAMRCRICGGELEFSHYAKNLIVTIEAAPSTFAEHATDCIIKKLCFCNACVKDKFCGAKTQDVLPAIEELVIKGMRK